STLQDGRKGSAPAATGAAGARLRRKSDESGLVAVLALVHDLEVGVLHRGLARGAVAGGLGVLGARRGRAVGGLGLLGPVEVLARRAPRRVELVHRRLDLGEVLVLVDLLEPLEGGLDLGPLL